MPSCVGGFKERFGKLVHRSFEGRTKWPENNTPVRGIVTMGVSCGFGGPLDSPILEALILSPFFFA